MFFVKIAFWVLLILILLPSNPHEKFEFYGTAQRSISEISTFCTRNNEVCDGTSAFFNTLYQKVATTTEMIEDMLRGTGIVDNRGSQPTPAAAPRRNERQGRNYGGARGASTSSFSQNTLTNDDLRPYWGGPRSAGYNGSRHRSY